MRGSQPLGCPPNVLALALCSCYQTRNQRILLLDLSEERKNTGAPVSWQVWPLRARTGQQLNQRIQSSIRFGELSEMCPQHLTQLGLGFGFQKMLLRFAISIR